MARINVDTLTAQRHEQFYTSLEETTFRYQFADGSFEWILNVDSDGLVLDYPNLFTRVD